MKTLVKRLAVTVAASCAIASTALANNSTITGAGSSFVYPVMSRWAYTYGNKTGTDINYQSIGSGGGLSQLKAKTIAFAAVDMPQSARTLTGERWLQFPVISGGIVMAVNIPGVKTNTLVLDGRTIADIYEGTVKYWDSAKIRKLNHHLHLPHMHITVVHRADGSGTTYNFTHYLSQIDSNWKKHYGFSTSIDWPVGLGAKGNSGVALEVKRIPGGIGYVEYSYAKQTGLPWAKMRNRSGHVVSPSYKTFQAAAANARWTHVKNFDLLLTNQPGRYSWPMTATTFMLLRNVPANKAINHQIITFMHWCYTTGASAAKPLDYVPMPHNVVHLIERYWHKNLK